MSCDAELQELMSQVDRMVEQKKNEWDEKMKLSENKLAYYIEENGILKHKLSEKCDQVDNLKHRFSYKENMSQINDYDENVQQLKSDLSNIRKSYEKYQQKYIKKIKEMEKEKESQNHEKLELIKQLNDFKCAANKWKYEKAQLMEQIDELTTKNKEISHEKEMVGEQLKLVRLDYNEHKSNWTELEQKYSGQIREMQNSLRDAKDSFQKEADDSRDKVSEIMQQMKRAVEEKHQLLADNESAKRMIIKLENELARTSGLLKSKDKSVFKLEQSVQMSERTISEKNDVIKILQSNSSSKELESVKIKLESELAEVRSQLKVSKRNEKSLQNETTNLQKQIECLNKKMLEQNEDTSEMNEKKTEVETKNRKLMNQLQEMEESVNIKDEQLMIIKQELTNLQKEVTFLRSNSNYNSALSKDGYQATNNYSSNNTYIEKSSTSHQQSQFNTANKTSNQNIKSTIPSNHNTEPMKLEAPKKEVDFLFKFCEEKDLVIQRLQMENQVLQEFITKINATMLDQTSNTNTTTPFGMFNKPPTEFTNHNSHPTSQSFTNFMSTTNNNNNNGNEINEDNNAGDMNADIIREFGHKLISNDTVTNCELFHTMKEVSPIYTPDNSTNSNNKTLKLSEFSDDDDDDDEDDDAADANNNNNNPSTSVHLDSMLLPLNSQKPPIHSHSMYNPHNSILKSQSSPQNLWNNLQRSSDEFITNLSSSLDRSIIKNNRDPVTSSKTNIISDRSRNSDINNNNDSPVLQNLYPTLAAARYFNQERDRTRQLETIIDQHMVQLKQHTQQIVQKNNFSNKYPQDNYNS